MSRVASVLAILVAGCSASGPEVVAPPATPVAASAASASPATPKVRAPLSIALQPLPEAMALDVGIDIAPPIDPSDLAIEAPDPGAVGAVKASDASGDVAVKLEGGPKGSLSLRLARPVRGTLHVSYRVAAKAPTLAVFPSVEIDGDKWRASGRAFLALPKAILHHAANVALTVNPYAEAKVASSFGIGAERTFEATGIDLGDALFVAGALGEARFDGPEGHDEAAWSGYTAFDPRPIAADVAAFRTAARQALHEQRSDAMTLLIVADGRPHNHFVAARRASSVVVHVGIGEPWGGALRLSVAAEVLKRWIGGEVWLGPSDAAHEAEGYWFSEGVARGLARSMLFRFGVITPAEMLDEVSGLETVALTSRLRGLSNAALAARAKEPGALPLLVARGALYAARVDALVRKKTSGKHSLDDVVRALVARARSARGPLPTAAWLDAVRDDLGESEAQAFASTIDRGEVMRLPDDALGPCFSVGQRRFVGFDLGFDLDATQASSPHRVLGLEPNGPAARAGLTDADQLVEAKPVVEHADVRVTLTFERDGARRTLSYLPAGASASGQAFTRRKDVADEACTK